MISHSQAPHYQATSTYSQKINVRLITKTANPRVAAGCDTVFRASFVLNARQARRQRGAGLTLCPSSPRRACQPVARRPPRRARAPGRPHRGQRAAGDDRGNCGKSAVGHTAHGSRRQGQAPAHGARSGCRARPGRAGRVRGRGGRVLMAPGGQPPTRSIPAAAILARTFVRLSAAKLR